MFMKKNVQRIKRSVQVIDATDMALGRLATKISHLLQGKHKKTWQSHIDDGDIVEIQNLKFAKLTGNKWNGRIYYRYSGYPGGMRKQTAAQVFAKNPHKLIQMMVSTMLPKNTFRSVRLKRIRFDS